MEYEEEGIRKDLGNAEEEAEEAKEEEGEEAEEAKEEEGEGEAEEEKEKGKATP